MVAEHRQGARGETGAAERLDGRAQEPGVARRVDIGPVVERIWVELRLHAVVTVGSAPRLHRAARESRKRLCQLVVLGVVDQIAALDHELRTQPADRRHRTGEHL